jgi:hypothetical protein
MPMRRHLGTLAALLVLASACSSGGEPGVHASFDCVAAVEIDGERYVGHGDLERTPETTGRTEPATRPGCDDGGGAEPDQRVQAEELVGIPMSEGVLVDGSFYVRDDGTFPEEARAWFEPVTCQEEAAFEVSGPWEGARSEHRARFDGDLRPPYRLTMWVSQGPREYVGSRITVLADERTDPQLGPEDVKQTLWEGGDVVATVHCEGDRFVADGLRSLDRA